MPDEATVRSRFVRLIPAWAAFVLVMIFGPRMDGARIMCGHEFRTKSGGPGLTDLGLVLLIVVPVAVYLVMGWIQRWWSRRSERRWPTR